MNDDNERDWSRFRHPAMNYKPPRQLVRFRLGVRALAALLLVVGVWTALWFAVMTYGRTQVKNFIVDEQARGHAVAYDVLDVSGYPGRIQIRIDQPRYQGALGDMPFAWQGDVLKIELKPWWPLTARLDAAGRQSIEWGTDRLALSGLAERLNAVVSLNPGWPETLTLDIGNLVLSGAESVIVQGLRLTSRHDAAVTAGGVGLSIDAQGEGMTLPMGGGWGLGDQITSLDLGLRVVGPVQPGPLAERLEEWRSVGGAVEIERLKMRMGPLALATSGTAALDGQLQPEGAFTAKIEGLFQVLEIFRARRLIGDGEALMATMALAALSKRPQNGEASSINLSVTVQGGKVYLGGVPVATLPTLDWGQPKPQPVEPVENETPPARDYKNAPPVY